MEEALFLAKFADSVTVVHRREELRASDIMANRVLDHDAISVRWNTELQAIHGSRDDGVTGATLVSHPEGYPKRRADDGESVDAERVDVQGVFYAIGHTPNTGFLTDTAVELDSDGYVRTETDESGRATTETGVDGVFAAGDVADPTYRQAITAAGTGSMAALDAEEYVESLGSRSPADLEGIPTAN